MHELQLRKNRRKCWRKGDLRGRALRYLCVFKRRLHCRRLRVVLSEINRRQNRVDVECENLCQWSVQFATPGRLWIVFWRLKGKLRNWPLKTTRIFSWNTRAKWSCVLLKRSESTAKQRPAHLATCPRNAPTDTATCSQLATPASRSKKVTSSRSKRFATKAFSTRTRARPKMARLHLDSVLSVSCSLLYEFKIQQRNF